MKRTTAGLILLGWCASWGTAVETATLINPTKTAYVDEVARLDVAIPKSARAGEYVVKAGSDEIPCQIAERGGKKWVWVLTSLEPGQKKEYSVQRGEPSGKHLLVSIEREGGFYVLDNGETAVRVPAEADDVIPPPIQSVWIAGKWGGTGFWHTSHKLKSFTAVALDEGPLFVRVRLRYEFEGNAGLYENVPAFAEVDVVMYPKQHHTVIEESHEMNRGDFWEFDCAAGWNAPRAMCITHGRMPAHGGPQVRVPTDLTVGQTRMYDTLLNLQPRWSQAYDEGWFFVCRNEKDAVGAAVCFASKWHWPHNNLIEVKVKESGNYAGLRCPTWKGRRKWFLLAGPAGLWEGAGARSYITRYAFRPLNKLNNDYVLEWPGLEVLRLEGSGRKDKLGNFRGMDFYSSQMNPSSMLRGFGRRAIREADRQGNIETLTHAQVFFDNDSYGSYWNFWSPENANFFTDFLKAGYGLTMQLRKHPRFREFAKEAELKFREDMYHSITLPGGAGQECPGYVAYAMRNWQELAPLCRQYFGFDPVSWPRYKAGASFLLHVSQPTGDGSRRCHPGGDTHPPGRDVLALADQFGVKEDIRQFRSEELPGFGVVFRNHPGTDKETYLAFKSGPNRGHYHGDQLSFHYCADAEPLAIDHMCSYSPRAGQEHMHNRVAFHTDKLPFANMDGYERVIAFKSSPDVDIAVGQVESERLRITTEYPPEEWDTYLPEQRFDELLKYRRTVVCLKNRGKDYFVIRDQHVGPSVEATWCLHVLSDTCNRSGNIINFDRLAVVCASPERFDYDRHDWDFEKKDKAGRIIITENTKGIRLTTRGRQTEFITVLYQDIKTPEIERIDNGVRIAGDRVTFGGRIDDVDDVSYVTVERDGKLLLQLTGRDIDMDRSQGEIGLFVPDAGYPFGEIPDWLIKQRNNIPDWAPDWVHSARRCDTD